MSRESLLKGGESGDPAVSPGYAEESVLIQYVSGTIEDLEMPPLDQAAKNIRRCPTKNGRCCARGSMPARLGRLRLFQSDHR